MPHWSKSSSAGNTNYPCCCFSAFNSKNLNIVLHSPLASSCGPLPVSLSHVPLIFFFFKLCLMFPQRTVFFSEWKKNVILIHSLALYAPRPHLTWLWVGLGLELFSVLCVPWVLRMCKMVIELQFCVHVCASLLRGTWTCVGRQTCECRNQR